MTNEKKKTRKEDSLVALLLFIFFCLIGSGIFITLFVLDLNKTLTKLNETPIALISFKHKSANRKFLDREIWDKLKKKSPLYNGDTIRTAPLSEATIAFNENDNIELYEDSIIQIFKDGEEYVLNVAGGNVIVNTKEGSSGIKIHIGKVYTKLSGGTSISIRNDSKNNLSGLQVLSGKAELISEDSKSQTLSNEDSIAYFGEHGFFDSENIPLITVKNPPPNAKILSSTKGNYVNFRWKTKNTENEKILLKVSKNRDFEPFELYDISDKNGDEGFNIEADSQQLYWKIYPENFGEKFKVQNKVSIISIDKPNLIVPANDYKISYKSELPNVRFSWSDNDWTQKYIIELSQNKDFLGETRKIETTDSYITLPDFSEGTWYWRVFSVIGSNKSDENYCSETRSFVVTQNSILPKVTLFQPYNKYVYNTKVKKDSEYLSFSWKKSTNASFYKLKISRDSGFNFSDIDIETSENVFKLTKAEIDSLLGKSNEWYWAVFQGDEDGNISEVSDVRVFSIVNGDYENNLIFPPNDFEIETTYVENTNFIWKANFTPKENQIFQVATDEDFYNIVINESVNKENIEEATSIKSLKNKANKQYFWRTIAKTDENKEIISETRSFKIKTPFKAPENASPSGKIKIGVKKEQNTTFRWEKIDGADSYSFKLAKAQAENIPLYENNFITTNLIDINLSQFEDGDYVWTVQANAMENEKSTRFTGNISRNKFEIRKLEISKLVSPENNSVYDGLESFIHPLQAKWLKNEKDQISTFKLYKIDSNGNEKLIQTIQNPKENIQLPRLKSGKYAWTIEGKTFDGFDSSALHKNNFEITQIPKLPAPKLLQPTNQYIIDAKALKDNKSIIFKWEKIEAANNYIITIRNKNGKVLKKYNTKTTPKLVFKNIDLLSRGQFSWSVEARQVLKDGTIVRKSNSKTMNFEIDIPVINEIELNETGELYGL